MTTILYFLSLLPCGASLEALADDRYQVREQATRWLADHWLLALPLLNRGEHSLDPEVRRRCREAMVRPRHLQASWTASCLLVGGDQPWITFQESRSFLADRLILQELVRMCQRRHLLLPGERYDDRSAEGLCGFLNVMRYRYRGLPPPP